MHFNVLPAVAEISKLFRYLTKIWTTKDTMSKGFDSRCSCKCNCTLAFFVRQHHQTVDINVTVTAYNPATINRTVRDEQPHEVLELPDTYVYRLLILFIIYLQNTPIKHILRHNTHRTQNLLLRIIRYGMQVTLKKLQGDYW